MGTGARIKGYIKNNVTGELMSFLFNPPSFSYSRGATFSEISSPGLSYPHLQYVRGNSTSFSLELYLHDLPFTGKITPQKKFLDKLLPPEKHSSTFKKPPDITVCWGKIIKRCVVETLDENYTMIDAKGNPTEATFTLSLRQI